MFIDSTDHLLQNLPLFGKYYTRNNARLKRKLCLLLHRWNLLKPFSFVSWLATYECNFRCPFCEASAGRAAENELTTAEATALLDDLAQMGVRRLVISGGEPLVRRDLMDIMDHGRKKGLRFGLVTNSYLVDTLWDRLKRFQYFLYFTSLDGLPEYHDANRRRGSFRKAMEALDLFATLGVRTRMINTVLHSDNVDQLEELYPLIKHSAANRWHIAPIVDVGRYEDRKKYGLDDRILKYVVGFIDRHRQERDLTIDLAEACSYIGFFHKRPVGRPFFCGAGLTRCSIMPDGEVLGCHNVYDHSFSEGNIRDKAFSRIWKQNFTRFRENRRLPEVCQGCLYLRQCQGGCWAEMELHNACLKAVWEKHP